MATYSVAFAHGDSTSLWFPGPCPGQCSQLSAVRAELSSKKVTLHIMYTTCLHCNVTNGSALLQIFYNDCLKALRLINSPGRKLKRFLADDYDLLNEPCTLLASLQQQISVSLLGVKGHYNGTKREIQHDLNAEAHHILHSFLKEINHASPWHIFTI